MQTPSETSDADPGLGQRLDALPLSWLHLLTFTVCALALFFDALELSMNSVLGVALGGGSAHAGPGAGRVGLVLGSVAVGGAVGAVLLGRHADAAGRRRACIVILVGFGLSSIAAAYTTTIEQLAVLRLVGGFFLGAFAPVLNVFLVDVIPAPFRGRLIMLLVMVSSFGASAAPALTRWFGRWQWLGLEGWRGVMVFGGCGGLAMAMAFLLLPESPRWLSSRGRADAARSVFDRFAASRAVFRPRAAAATHVPTRAVDAGLPATQGGGWSPLVRRRLALFCTLEFIVPWAMLGFISLQGVLFMRRGHAMDNVLGLLAITGLGVPVGALIGAFVVDRFSRRHVLLVCALGTAVMGVAFALSPSVPLAVASAALYAMFVIIYFQLLMIYGAEFFPAAQRGTAVGSGYTFNRIGTFLTPTLLMPFLQRFGEGPLIAVFCGCMLVSAALILRFGPRTTS